MQLPSKTPKQGTCDKLLADAVDFPTPDGSKNRLFLICAKTGYSLAEVHISVVLLRQQSMKLWQVDGTALERRWSGEVKRR